ncbi:hypothetical protein EDD21DRAFT_311321 [Dissophora ornata]|nr:hypothetical protein EDD21DRAFT_311321 [Dissophora ornata]
MFVSSPLLSTSWGPPDESECSPRNNNYKLTLSVLVLIGIIVSYLPQVFRIIHKKSSDGFSPWFLLIGCLSTCWSFFNILIMEWRGISCCTVVGAGRCMESILGIAQLFVQFVLFTLIFVLYMIYYPPGKKTNRLVRILHLICLPSRSFSWAISLFFAKVILGNFVVTTVITIISLIFVDDTIDRRSSWTLFWAGFLGVASVLLTMIQHIPQIVETSIRKSVGALSIPTMLMQTPAAIIMTVSLALSPGVNWSTWFPYAVSALLQAVLLGMCLHYYFRAKHLGLSSFHSAERTPLLMVHDDVHDYGIHGEEAQEFSEPGGRFEEGVGGSSKTAVERSGGVAAAEENGRPGVIAKVESELRRI